MAMVVPHATVAGLVVGQRLAHTHAPPVQVAVATIVSDADPYAEEVAAALRAAGLAVVLDLSNQKINAKVREHSVQHVPVIAVLGRKEAEQRTVALRRLGGDSQEVLPLDQAVARLKAEAMAPDLRRGIT